MLDHIKREVVKPAESPDGDAQKSRGFPFRLQKNEQCGSEQTKHEKKQAFELDQSWVGEVFHAAGAAFISS